VLQAKGSRPEPAGGIGADAKLAPSSPGVQAIVAAAPQIPGYQLLRQIGAGGMATVYLAMQVSLERKVAIKVLRTHAEDDPERTEKRFLREGRTLAKITHKNVCGIYDIAKIGDVAYIAMEYLDGGTLVDKLKQGVAVGESIAIAVQLASALDEAHKLGIIHRDLKPANVMLRGGRVPVLTDFGIARELTASQTRITAENMIVGTPIYMSPEQVSGGEVDGRSDLYSLGIMFHELLTGEPPYKGDTPIAVCMQHLTAPLPKLPLELADLQPVMDRMLAKKREERFASMAEFTHALRDVFVTSDAMRHVAMFSPDTPWSEQLRDLGFSFDTLRDADVKAALEAQRRRNQPAAAARKGDPAARTSVSATASGRRRWPLWAALALALLLIAGGAGWWLTRTRPPTEAERLALMQRQLEFSNRLAADQLLEPIGQSALDSLQAMRDIHATAEETVAVLTSLQRALLERARSEIAARNLMALDVTLAAIAVALPEMAEREELLRQRTALASELAGEDAVRTRLARLRSLVEGAAPSAGESVLGLYLELRPALAADAEFQAIEAGAQRSARTAIEVALANGEEARALADARSLAQVLPQDKELQELVAQLGARVASGELRRAAADWSEAVKAEVIDSARLAQLLAGLARLAELGQPAAEHAKMRELLANAVLFDAERLIKSGDLDGALGLLGQARAGLGDLPRLVETQQSVSRSREETALAQRKAAERARQGQLAISSAPWARIEKIVDSAGRPVVLPGNASTPLLLTLPEGSYRVTAVAGQGTGRREEGVLIERGKLATITLRFTGFGADQFMREVQW
jgi:serine/threonine-protein kinase PpkA